MVEGVGGVADGCTRQDLRVYTIWRAEISHFKTQHMSYRKSGTEVGQTLALSRLPYRVQPPQLTHSPLSDLLSGKSSVNSLNVFITRKKPKTPINVVSIRNSLLVRG